MYYYSLISLQPWPHVGQVSYLRADFQSALPKFFRQAYPLVAAPLPCGPG
jgi:hypothetical protein